jgi:hypothetical protein
MGCNACKGDEKESEENLATMGGATKGGKRNVKASKNRDVSNREKRDAYSFENGAVFTGDWIGEERDGMGT